MNIPDDYIKHLHNEILLKSSNAKSYDSEQYYNGQLDLLEELMDEFK